MPLTEHPHSGPGRLVVKTLPTHQLEIHHHAKLYMCAPRWSPARIALIASAVLCLGGPASSAFADSRDQRSPSPRAVFPSGNLIPSQLREDAAHNRALRNVDRAGPHPAYAFTLLDRPRCADHRTGYRLMPRATTRHPGHCLVCRSEPVHATLPPGTGVSTVRRSSLNRCVIPPRRSPRSRHASAWAGGRHQRLHDDESDRGRPLRACLDWLSAVKGPSAMPAA